MKKRITISLGKIDHFSAIKFEGEIYQHPNDANRIIIRVGSMNQIRNILYSRPFEGVPVVFINECYDSYRLSFSRQPNTHFYISAKETTNFIPFRQ